MAETTAREETLAHLNRWLDAHNARCIREESTRGANGRKDGGRMSFYNVKGNLLVVQEFRGLHQGFIILVSPTDSGRLDSDLDALSTRWEGVLGYHAGDKK